MAHGCLPRAQQVTGTERGHRIVVTECPSTVRCCPLLVTLEQRPILKLPREANPVQPGKKFWGPGSRKLAWACDCWFVVVTGVKCSKIGTS